MAKDPVARVPSSGGSRGVRGNTGCNGLARFLHSLCLARNSAGSLCVGRIAPVVFGKEQRCQGRSLDVALCSVRNSTRRIATDTTPALCSTRNSTKPGCCRGSRARSGRGGAQCLAPLRPWSLGGLSLAARRFAPVPFELGTLLACSTRPKKTRPARSRKTPAPCNPRANSRFRYRSGALRCIWTE